MSTWIPKIEILRSAAGYYIGCWDHGPYCRLSAQYFESKSVAEDALNSGSWSLRNAFEMEDINEASILQLELRGLPLPKPAVRFIY